MNVRALAGSGGRYALRNIPCRARPTANLARQVFGSETRPACDREINGTSKTDAPAFSREQPERQYSRIRESRSSQAMGSHGTMPFIVEVSLHTHPNNLPRIQTLTRRQTALNAPSRLLLLRRRGVGFLHVRFVRFLMRAVADGHADADLPSKETESAKAYGLAGGKEE